MYTTYVGFAEILLDIRKVNCVKINGISFVTVIYLLLHILIEISR